MTVADTRFLSSFDQTHPVLWAAENPDVAASTTRLTGLLMHDWTRLQWFDSYQEGQQPLSYMSPAMQKEVGQYVRTVILNWPRLVTEAYETRLDVTGFRYGGDEQVDKDLRRVWQHNGLDALASQAHTEALALGRAYVIVGSPDDGGDPVVTVESPFQVTALRDPRTRKVVEAVKVWQELDGTRRATLYQPNRTVQLVARSGKWEPIDVDDHMLGAVPVVPVVNRSRVLRPDGLPEFFDVIPIVDAAIKAATDMMISAEYHAMPRRWIFGMKNADFKDQSGNAVSAWSRIAGRIWSHESADIKVGQFPEAALTNFHETIKMLAQLASQMAALPADHLAFNNVNPTSADALRALDARLVKRIERKQIYFGEAWEDVMRLILRFQTGKWDEKAETLETVWADPSTPSIAQKADAVVKLASGSNPIIPVEQAREDLGYGPIARERMAEMDTRAATLGLRAIQDGFAPAAGE